MNPEQKTEELVGRGNKEGADLFREWFGRLNGVAENGGHAAYVFVMGSMAEILQVFDIPMVFPEINSLQTAIRRVAHEYLNEAEDYGYSPDICGYVKADVALQLREGEHPMGQVPKPTMAVLTNACNTYIKWAEIWERMYEVPAFVVDVPGTRMAGGKTSPGDNGFESDRRYVQAQIKELIELCEELTGKSFDIDKLRQSMQYSNEMNRSWKRVLELNQAKPSVFNALTDGTIYLGVSNGFRGTEEGSRYFQRLQEEMEFKSAENIGTLTDEEYRLTFVGVPCYPIFRRFNEFFSEWKGAFVSSTYLWFASGGANRGFEYDLEKPLESL
ncbi:MAG: 2-hydroxyacyl-CoA dehydratase family protein, partial [Anaerolineae bacterium]|nr:2-hydroxyacyl-CoA dehydratase family protein [Anaerolineae bacterium]